MSQLTIEDKVRDVLVARFGADPEHQKPEAKLGLDEFNRLGVVWDIENKFKINISDEEELRIDTVQDLIRLVRSKVTQ